MMTPRTLAATLLLSFGLAACAAPSALPPVPTTAPAPMSTPAPAATVTPMPAPEMSATPAATATPASSPDLVAGAAVLSAQTIAGQTLGVPGGEVKVLAVEPVTWNDASLGCPQPDMMYAQVMTPGYQVQVEVAGEAHTVHMDEAGNGVVCDQP